MQRVHNRKLIAFLRVVTPSTNDPRIDWPNLNKLTLVLQTRKQAPLRFAKVAKELHMRQMLDLHARTAPAEVH